MYGRAHTYSYSYIATPAAGAIIAPILKNVVFQFTFAVSSVFRVRGWVEFDDKPAG